MDLKQGLFTNFANFDDTIISKKNYQILIDRVRILINGGEEKWNVLGVLIN